MRLWLIGFAAAVGPTPLAGQATVRLAAGATYSSALIDDGVLSTKLRQAIAPTVSLGLSYPTGKGPYRVVAEVTYARSALNVTTRDNVSQDRLAAVATVSTLVLAEGTVRGALRWQLGGGAVFYEPSERQGVFQDGGTHRWMIAGGLTWTRRISAAMDLLITGRLDTHMFTTDVLQARSYGGTQAVQRIGLLVGVNRPW